MSEPMKSAYARSARMVTDRKYLKRELVGLGLVAGHLSGLGGRLEAGSILLDSVRTSLDDGSVVGRSTTVPGEQVGGARWDIIQSTNGGDADDRVLKFLWGDLFNGVSRVGRWLKRQVVGQETGNVGKVLVNKLS